MFHFPLWDWVWLAKSLKRPFTESRGYPQQFVGNFVGKDIPMPLTHNTLMKLPLNKMIADTNGLYFKRTGPQKGTWTFRYMRHGPAAHHEPWTLPCPFHGRGTQETPPKSSALI